MLNSVNLRGVFNTDPYKVVDDTGRPCCMALIKNKVGKNENLFEVRFSGAQAENILADCRNGDNILITGNILTEDIGETIRYIIACQYVEYIELKKWSKK